MEDKKMVSLGPDLLYMDDLYLSEKLKNLVLDEHHIKNVQPGLDIVRELEPQLYPALMKLHSFETSCQFLRSDTEMRIKSPEVWRIQMESCQEALDKATEEAVHLFSQKGFDPGF